jgi:hypothetical protein
MVKVEKGNLLHSLGPAKERGRVHTQSSFSNLQVQTRALALNRQRIRVGDKRYELNSPSHMCGLAGHYLSPWSSRVIEKLLWLSSLEGSNLVPKTWLVPLQGAASALQVIVHIWGAVCPVRLCCSLGVVSGSCHKDVIDRSCPSLSPRWLQERMTQRKGQQAQNGDRHAKLFSCV